MSATILIVDDEQIFRENTSEYLTARGYETIEADSLQEARKIINNRSADIVLLDNQLPDGLGESLLDETVSMPLRPPIIMITAFGDIDMAVDVMKKGAHDFLQKPIQFTQLEKSIQRAEEIVNMRRELTHLRNSRQSSLDFVIGSTEEMKNLVNEAQRAAEASVSVLITGETGTGKEVLANAIHKIGPRANKPFIGINCAAIQSTVLESELFGYEEGAFTDARKRKLGLMEVADGGILFLDEISSMPIDMQAKLLRALDEHAIRRVGGTKLIKIDVQIIAASNRDLKKMIRDGSFREDLYYRLKVVNLDLPPLRNRKEDIPQLVGLFIQKNNQRMGKNVNDITQPAMQALMIYDWLGNIRELAHVIERAILFCDEEAIDLPHLPREIVSNFQQNM
jgi:DNA-binding NtrC family response regulator